MSGIGVRVDSRSIRKAMRDAGGDFWALFRTDNCTVKTLGDVLNQVNDPDGTFGEGPWQTPGGFVIRVQPGGSDNFDEWISRLVAGLEELAATGRLEGTKPTYIGDWPTEDPTPAAFLAWAEDLDAAMADPNRRSHWHVPPEATERIVKHAAAWTEAGGDQSIVNRALSRSPCPLRLTSPR